MKKNILIFGGNGLIGNSLLNSKNLSSKYNLICLDKNSSNIKNKKTFFKVDTNQPSEILKNINKISKIYGPIYGLINTTYPKVLQKKKPNKINSELFLKEINIHLGSFLNTTQIMCDYFLNKKIKGKIINFASIYGEFIPRFEIYNNTKIIAPLQYSIIKNSIITMSKYFAKFFLKKKININCISPGGIYDYQDKNFVSRYSRFCAEGMLKKDDLEGVVFFLLSSGADKIYGQNIIVDDGFTL